MCTRVVRDAVRTAWLALNRVLNRVMTGLRR